MRNQSKCTLELILDSCTTELTPVDEVWPNLYLGNVAIAQNRSALCKLGVTHVLNAAHSKQGSIGDQSFYGDSCIYCGIPAEDSHNFDISQYFKPAADFIHEALRNKDGKVLVHCIMGISRSATLVLAYLMLRRRLSLCSALSTPFSSDAISTICERCDPSIHFLNPFVPGRLEPIPAVIRQQTD
ncbi:hypothetical protein LDENG_00185100 [Lucifuga dentata]|nr:hypothetical protein LDENG_00185100 [Lucifuga dentata]